MSENTQQTGSFLKRVGDLPVVQLVLVRTLDVYGRAKEFSTIARLSFNAAETTFAFASEGAKPIVAKFSTPLTAADNFACKTLAVLETKLPIITKTPDEIVLQAKQLYADVVTTPAVAHYNGAKQYGCDKIVELRQYAVRKSYDLYETKYGRQFAIKFDSFLLVADGYVDSYLPAVQDANTQPGDHQSKMDTNDETLVKAAFLSAKLRQRVSAHAVVQYRIGRDRVVTLLAKLHITMDLMARLKKAALQTTDSAKATVGAIRKKVYELLVSFNEGDPEQEGNQTIEDKLVYLARVICRQLLSSYRKMVAALTLLPSELLPKLKQGKQYIVDLYVELKKTASLRDATGLLTLRAREAIEYVRDAIAHLDGPSASVSPSGSDFISCSSSVSSVDENDSTESSPRDEDAEPEQ